MELPSIYPIIDLDTADEAVRRAQAVLDGGAKIVQLRAKSASDQLFLDVARVVRDRTHRAGAQFVINDRADIAALARADAVHLGQTDLPPEDVRKWLPESIGIGWSCHSLDDVKRALEVDLAYIGYGPVFPTSSKQNPDPVVGLAGLTAARELAPKLPIVAIGGITFDRLPGVAQAGANSAAMISAIARGDVTTNTEKAIAAWR